jgi:hypothetical protein
VLSTTGASSTPNRDSSPASTWAVASASRPAATAAASMFATGATSSAHITVAGIGGYSSSRRASNSTLIAEIAASSCRTEAPAATLPATRSASVAGT